MNLQSTLGKFLLALFMVSSLCACSRYIEGEVFLDKNANNIRDFDETAIPGLRFTLTQDDATKQMGMTDAAGQFFVPMETDPLEAKYCVQVRSEDVAALKFFRGDEGKSFKAMKALEASPEPTAEAEEEDACEKTSDGEPDCSDKDCCGRSECEDAAGCRDDSDDECPKDSGGAPKCNDSRCSKEAACKTYSVKSMQACDQSKAVQTKMRLDVPVAMDYATRIASLEEVTLEPVTPGEPFGIEMTYPSACTFQTYILPDGLSPIGLGNDFNLITREIFLSRAVRNLPWQVITLDEPPFGQDALHTFILRLQTDSGEGLTDNLKLQPTLICPDGRTVLARAVVIPFNL